MVEEHHRKRKRVRRTAKFPILAVLLLIFAVTWLLEELGFWVIDFPWIPVVLIIVALAMIFNRFR